MIKKYYNNNIILYIMPINKLFTNYIFLFLLFIKNKKRIEV